LTVLLPAPLACCRFELGRGDRCIAALAQAQAMAGTPDRSDLACATVSKPHDAAYLIVGVEFLADGIGEDRASRSMVRWLQHDRRV
jgi:hypothetical protein